MQGRSASALRREFDVTLHDVALMTAAENSWKVRVLEAVPGF
jgi:hypothetical protein